ncbi:GtrA family protein [Micromonospora sp. NBC_00821]|uniref:GtrA family protein n=1 Tax=Micromonospora sp. NBC_00821 TaxID=2975977 RepID=UPI002ED2AA4D|nr:GtrA family protein [Micromonospora sp. NBC_00821]
MLPLVRGAVVGGGHRPGEDDQEERGEGEGPVSSACVHGGRRASAGGRRRHSSGIRHVNLAARAGRPRWVDGQTIDSLVVLTAPGPPLENSLLSPVADSVRHLSRHSAVRFLVVGGLSVAVDTGSLFVYHGVLRIVLPVAAGMSFLTSFWVNFGLNRAWSFGSSAQMVPQVGRYFALVLANLTANVVLVSALTWAGTPYLLAKLLVTASLSAANYVVSKRWIFAA